MPDSVGMETDLARAPMFAAGSSASTQYTLPGPIEAGSLYSYAFSVTAHAGWPTTRDLLVLSDLTGRYAKMGCPESGLVPISGRELCRAAGYPDGGGWQFKEACECLMRLRSLTLLHVIPLPGGSVSARVWGPLDAGFLQSGPDGNSNVRISEQLARLIREGRLVYLHRETLHELFRRDHYAARLWTFLESESFLTPFKLRLFSAPEGEPPEATYVPAIADLLWLSGWTRRRKVKERVERAAEVVHEVDPHYRLSVEPARQPSMWNLCISKNEHVES